MADATDALLAMYESEMSLAKQAEDQRATFTNLVLIIASVILGLIPNSGGLVKANLPMTISLIVLGLYGAVVSQKLYERHRFHYGRARYYRRRINDLIPDANIRKLMDDAEEEHKKKFKGFYRVSLNRLWTLLHLAIAAVGLTLSIIVLMS